MAMKFAVEISYDPGFNREITKSFWYKQMGLPYNGE